jgi:hypothetical protein
MLASLVCPSSCLAPAWLPIPPARVGGLVNDDERMGGMCVRACVRVCVTLLH